MTDKTRILIVDDEELNVELLADVLQDEGYETNIAPNGESAIQKFTAFKPHLVLLDVMMPGIDGYETCVELRKLTSDETPIIFLSAKASLEDKLKGYEVGGNEYVTKPFNSKELMVKIKLLLETSRHMEQLEQNIKEAQNITFNTMSSASMMGAIGRFMQQCMKCSDIDCLSSLFREVVWSEFGFPYTLMIHDQEQNIIQSNDEIIRPLDRDIVSNVRKKEKIFRFGNNRALFNWGSVVLLVRKIGDKADYLAILLDGFSAGLKSVQTQRLLIYTINEFQQQNQELEIKSAVAVDDLDEKLRKVFDELGAGSSLCESDEEKLSEIVNNSREFLDNLLLDSIQRGNKLKESLHLLNPDHQNS